VTDDRDSKFPICLRSAQSAVHIQNLVTKSSHRWERLRTPAVSLSNQHAEKQRRKWRKLRN